MTTYTITGDTFFLNTVTGTPLDASSNSATLQISVPDIVTGFSYTVEPILPGVLDFGPATVDIDIGSVRINDRLIDLETSQALFLRIEWAEFGIFPRTTTVIDITVPNIFEPGQGFVTAEYFFELQGDPLPFFNSAVSANSFLNSFTGGGNPLFPFAPGSFIPFSRLNATVTQDDLLIGTTGVDVIDGGPGDDRIDGRDGNDLLSGGLGNDNLRGEFGADTLSGGEGDDGLDGGLGADLLNGGGGADTLNGDDGADTLNGETGDDVLNGGFDADILNGGAGNDRLFGDGFFAAAADVLRGGDGDDVLDGGGGGDVLDGGAGRDQARYLDASTGIQVDLNNPGQNTGDAAGDTYTSIEIIRATLQDDMLYGNGSDNQFLGVVGDDMIDGRAGDDTINGGGGDDVLIGGAGADKIVGGGNRDTASYSTANAGVTVEMRNMAANTGDAAGDRFIGIENLTGSGFDDTLIGSNGGNVISGLRGNDLLDGLAGNDTLLGLAGNDMLFGRAANDRLEGGAGHDLLNGGAGNDTLTGGDGVDTFVFNGGRDRVSDFSARDKIRLDDALWSGALTKAEVLDLAAVEGANTVFRFEGGDRLILENWTDLTALDKAVEIF